MENINPAQLLRSIRQRKYLAKDFSSLKSNLVEYAKLFDIEDKSESGIVGMLLEFAAYVGDNTSFYLDHQFTELNPQKAVETINIERHLNNAGVPITGASPALVYETIYVTIPAVNGSPDETVFPIVQEGSTFLSRTGVVFNLLEDIDFTKIDSTTGELKASVSVQTTDSSGNPKSFTLSARGLCMSGTETTETFSIGTTFVPFRKISLSNSNVQEITLVSDNLGNIYYEVNSLSDDVVFERKENLSLDSDEVTNVLQLKPAPYRFTTSTTLSDRSTTLTFGGGSASSLEDDVIPDPTDFALPIRHKKTFPRIAINPEKMLTSRTLGVAATNTTLSISYRYGGGLSHNVRKDSIRSVQTLNMIFPNSPSAAAAGKVRDTIEVNNLENAQGGEDALTVDELRALIPSYRNSQERIASKEDLLARVYTIPSNYGRVFRASVMDNPSNPNSAELHIISRDLNGKLKTSPDSLKKNLKVYLRPFRMISDAIDVFDSQIINLTVTVSAVIDPKLNKESILKNVINELTKYFDQKNFNINQAINISDVKNIIWMVEGVRSIDILKFETISGDYGTRSYNRSSFNVKNNTVKGFIFPPRGGIFEIKYPKFDIVGKAI